MSEEEEDFLRLENVKVHFPIRGGVLEKQLVPVKQLME